MRRRRAALAIPATLLLSLLAAGFAGSATAGGPTSVLLVVPGEGRTASLYTGDSDYQLLSDLVGGFGPVTGSTKPPDGADNEGASGTNDSSGPGVTLTWLMHDITVWRLDRVYLNAPGGPLISTQTNTDGGDLWADPPTWRKAANGKSLTALLGRLGVGNAGTEVVPGPAATSPIASPAASPAPATADPGAATATPADRAGDRPDGRLWGPAGVLVGVALTLAARWRPTRSDDSAGSGSDPVEAGPESPVATAGRSRTETLSSHSPD